MKLSGIAGLLFGALAGFAVLVALIVLLVVFLTRKKQIKDIGKMSGGEKKDGALKKNHNKGDSSDLYYVDDRPGDGTTFCEDGSNLDR